MRIGGGLAVVGWALGTNRGSPIKPTDRFIQLLNTEVDRHLPQSIRPFVVRNRLDKIEKTGVAEEHPLLDLEGLTLAQQGHGIPPDDGRSVAKQLVDVLSEGVERAIVLLLFHSNRPSSMKAAFYFNRELNHKIFIYLSLARLARPASPGAHLEIGSGSRTGDLRQRTALPL